MKKFASLALVLLFLFAGCAPANPSVSATPGATSAPTASPSAASPSPTPVTEGEQALPSEAYRYYQPEGNYFYLDGSLTAQELDALALTLRLGEWKSLAVVLGAFGIRMQDAAWNDIRKSDLVRNYEYGDSSECIINMPSYDDAHGVAYIDILTFYHQDGTRYLLLFQKTESGDYSASSIITLREDYYAESPTFRFETLGAKTYLIWNGLTGHGTGFNDYGESWYDISRGLRVYSYSTDGYDAEWNMDRFDTQTWEDSVSYESITLSDSGDYYLNARTLQTFYPTGAAEIVYECDYRIFYDAKLDQFYTAYDALLSLYEEAANSPYEEIQTWAARRVAYIDELRDDDANPLPGESDRRVISQAQSQIGALPFYGRKLTLDQLFAFCINLNAAEAGGYAGMEQLLFANGIGVSYGEEGDPLRQTFEGISDVSCSIDMDTCKERVIFLHMSFYQQGQRRGLTFVYGISDEADKWGLFAALSYPLAGEYGVTEGLYPGIPLGYGLKIPIGEANGHPVYQSLILPRPYSAWLSFVSDYYDAQGNRHTLDFSAYDYSYRTGVVGRLYKTLYEAGNSYGSQTLYAEVYSDSDWERGALFADASAYDGIKEFFEWER